MIEIRPVNTRREKNIFLTFPWRMYKNDPLWVPPILAERVKATDPARGVFFKNGYADFFIAWKDGEPTGTICCSHEIGGDPGECSIGFFECIENYNIAVAMFQHAENWTRQHKLTMVCGTYNLDREDGRGILVEGYDRSPVILCGHNPPYYSGFFERFGFRKRHDDGLAYAAKLDPGNLKIQRLYKLAEGVRKRKNFTIRTVNMNDLNNELERVLILQNRALEHLTGFVPYTYEAIEAMLLPLKDLADPELILFVDSKLQ
jgi:hypothetical protein